MQTVLDLSQAQIHDLMLLRRLFFIKRKQLHVECTELTAKMHEQSSNPFALKMAVSAVAAQLRGNTVQDDQLWHRFGWAIYGGVSCQWMLSAGVQ